MPPPPPWYFSRRYLGRGYDSQCRSQPKGKNKLPRIVEWRPSCFVCTAVSVGCQYNSKHFLIPKVAPRSYLCLEEQVWPNVSQNETQNIRHTPMDFILQTQLFIDFTQHPEPIQVCSWIAHLSYHFFHAHYIPGLGVHSPLKPHPELDTSSFSILWMTQLRHRDVK